jgi:hypothetical protein
MACDSIRILPSVFPRHRFDFGLASCISTVEEESELLPATPPTVASSFDPTLQHQERDVILDPEFSLKTAARRHET